MKKICIFTGTRAEYGLLFPLMTEIKKDKTLKLQIIASGMHLKKEFGLTYKVIEKDGFSIDKMVDIGLISDTPVGLSKSIGVGMVRICKAYAELKPDIVVILGDRFEAFSAAFSAMISRIPLAHIQGGEATFGAIDEAIRHSITKMSHLHFTSAEKYRQTVIQLGEDPKRVFNVGALGLDNIKQQRLLSKKELEKEIGFTFADRNLLVAFHPVTLEDNTAKEQFSDLIDVLDEMKETHLIFTKSNADMGGRKINKMINDYVANNKHKTIAVTSMGQLKFLSTLQFVDVVIGNSSSGIIEAPSFKIATINIGDRQAGRIKAKNIIDCDPTKTSIRSAIKTAYSNNFRKRLRSVTNPYGDGKAAKRIKIVLKKYNFKYLLKKEFYTVRTRRRDRVIK